MCTGVAVTHTHMHARPKARTEKLFLVNEKDAEGLEAKSLAFNRVKEGRKVTRKRRDKLKQAAHFRSFDWAICYFFVTASLNLVFSFYFITCIRYFD